MILVPRCGSGAPDVGLVPRCRSAAPDMGGVLKYEESEMYRNFLPVLLSSLYLFSYPYCITCIWSSTGNTVGNYQIHVNE